MFISVPEIRSPAKKSRTSNSALSKLLYLSRWPDFTDESDISAIANCARVCAFLARKPSAGFLVYRNVDLPHSETEAILGRLLQTGCVSVFQENFISLAGESHAAFNAPDERRRRWLRPRGEKPKDSSHSFLDRLWKKLVPDSASSSGKGS